RRFVLPHDLLVFVGLDRAGLMAKENIAIGQLPAVLRCLAFHAPLDVAFRVNNANLPAVVIGAKERALRRSFSGVQHRQRDEYNRWNNPPSKTDHLLPFKLDGNESQSD